MKRNLALLFMILVFTTVFARDWIPNWKPVDLPNVKATVYYSKHHSQQKNGETVIWVYLNHDIPKLGKYFKSKKFLSEMQEWVLDCENIKGDVATIRYTNSTDPNNLKEFALVHPGGREILAKNHVKILCELNT